MLEIDERQFDLVDSKEINYIEWKKNPTKTGRMKTKIHHSDFIRIMKEYPDKTPSFYAYPPHKTMHTRNINQRLCNKHVYLFTKQNELFSKKIIYLAFSKMHQKSSGCNCVQLYFLCI